MPRKGAFVVIEAPGFTSVADEYFGGDGAYEEFKHALADNPERGGVMPGASPFRLLRWSDKRRGTARRLRIIYLYVPEIRALFLMDVHGKDEAELLYAQDKRSMREFARPLIQELTERHRKGKL